MSVGLIVTLVIIFFFLLMIISWSLKTVRQTERGLVERFGKFVRYANPGLIVLVPFIERVIRVNVTEQMVNSEKREIITKDSLNATVDSNVYFKVKADESSVKSAVYNVNNYTIQIIALAKTTLRNILGTMTLREANSQRDVINTQLRDQMSKETLSWGIEIVRTELKEIQPPETVQKAMNNVVIAENEKTAANDFATATETKADGEKRATIKIAEGNRQSVILQAEADKQSKILVAEGQAEAIRLVNESAEKYFTGNAQLLRKIEAVETSLKTNTKIVLPEGKELVNVISDSAGVVIPTANK